MGVPHKQRLLVMKGKYAHVVLSPMKFSQGVLHTTKLIHKCLLLWFWSVFNYQLGFSSNFFYIQGGVEREEEREREAYLSSIQHKSLTFHKFVVDSF